MDRLLFGGLPYQRGRRPETGMNQSGNDWDATAILSNMARVERPIEYNGVRFPSVEHAFQAAKFDDPEVAALLAGVASASDVKRLGGKRGQGDWPTRFGRPAPLMRSDWGDVKHAVLEELIEQKFRNNPALAKYLVDTGDRQLIENSTQWGDSEYGMVDPLARSSGFQADRLRGQNVTGVALMNVRSRLAMPEQPAAAANPTGQQTADAVQLDLWEKGKRFAGDAWPYLAAAGGAGLVGYAVADLMGQSPTPQGGGAGL